MKTKHAQNLIAVALVGGLAAMALLGAVAPAQGVESAPTRSIRITTKEVTDPDVAVSSDGKWLIFTALGHLFRLPTTGGAAEQLTSGPHYDAARVGARSGCTRKQHHILLFFGGAEQ